MSTLRPFSRSSQASRRRTTASWFVSTATSRASWICRKSNLTLANSTSVMASWPRRMARLRAPLQERSSASSTFCRGPPGPLSVASTRNSSSCYTRSNGTQQRRWELQLSVHDLGPLRLRLDEGVEGGTPSLQPPLLWGLPHPSTFKPLTLYTQATL